MCEEDYRTTTSTDTVGVWKSGPPLSDEVRAVGPVLGEGWIAEDGKRGGRSGRHVSCWGDIITATRWWGC